MDGLIEQTYAQSGDLYRSAGGSVSLTNYVKQYHQFERRQGVLNAAGESVSKRGDQLIEDTFPGLVGICWYLRHGPPFPWESPSWYSFAFGDIDHAALFVIGETKPLASAVQTPDEITTILYSLFEGYSVDAPMVAHELESGLRRAPVDDDPHMKSLKAISTAAMLFRHFPYASVDVRILQRELCNASWIRNCTASQEHQFVPKPLNKRPDRPYSLEAYALLEKQVPLSEQRRVRSAAMVLAPGYVKPTAAEGINERLPYVETVQRTPMALLPYVLTKSQTFACLAMFESGQHDIDPRLLEDVMAMSSGDSIYVSAALLTDPYDKIPPGDIRGFMGNVGRPGITFLVPPKDPLIKQVSIDEWALIEHDEFDGCLSDHFQDTSLHLSFTTAETPLNIRFSGGQDLEACIVETLFSVYDSGRWIVDLNTSNLIEAPRLTRLPRCTMQHSTDTSYSNTTCIDSWFSLVDAPEDRVSLVRASGNWQARLGAASISLSLGYDTILLSDNVCWQCFDRKTRECNKHIIAIG
ncbi:MAG: hypothetical protein Q9198_000642 [Flavoplaca austrocitrina]